MPYISPEVILEAKQIDLLTYLKACEPSQLVRVSGNTYCTKEHDSLKISNGKWMWWSRGIGGKTALDYLIKVQGYSFLEAVQAILGNTTVAYPVMGNVQKEEARAAETPLLLPEKCKSADKVTEYLFGRGIDYEIINYISATSPNHINAMDMNKEYGDGANPVILKSEFIMSLCEQLIGGNNLGAKQKSIIDRCTASVYRTYQQNDYQGTVPTLQDFRDELLKQDEPEAKEIALAIELFTHGSLNTFAKPTNVDTNSYLICYDILDLGKQLMPIGMLVVLDSILNRITQNRAKGKKTFIFIDEIYLLFQHEYSANFLFTLWKRVRKYGAYASGITQNVDDLLQSHTARTMLANSEFIIMLNQAATDRIELAKLLNISDLQMSYITNVEAGHGLIKVGSSLVPFVNKFPTNTQLYKLMTTKPGEGV